jgi:DNA-binding response OmpR family regulator
VLIIEDEKKMVTGLRFNLEARGYQVLTAQGGQEALDLFAAAEPDLLILDIQMPGMDGYTVCHCIRQRSTVPIIIASALDRAKAEAQSLRVGADRYLAKPFRISELVAQIQSLGDCQA